MPPADHAATRPASHDADHRADRPGDHLVDGSAGRPARRRLAVAGVLALTLVGGALLVPDPGDAGGSAPGTGFRARMAAETGAAPAGSAPSAPVDAPDGHGHDHTDPTTKNAISRAGRAAGSADPTTADEARASVEYVARSRRTADPELTTVPPRTPRHRTPRTRYAVAGGCYTLEGDPVRFRATDLGIHLLYDTARRFLTARPDGTVTWAAEPSPDAEWTTRRRDGRFTFRLPDGRALTRTADGLGTGGEPSRFALRRTRGCPAYPEPRVGVTGDPHAGVTPFQEVRGYVDAHTHGMAYEFLGGEVHCGKPWDKYGVAHALVDCEDHTLTDGKGAVLESALSGEPSHDPAGWPTLVDWPAPNSLTHEGTYHSWLERAWRGGQRVFVNLLVENGQLCTVYPLKRNSCDEMTSVRLQARRMRELERYVDAQYGGPGRGWYRIVTTPWEARRVINEGKLAVIMGIETSVPFGCSVKRVVGGDRAECDEASVNRQIDEMWRLGVRQMELVNKFDNALSGVAGDAGETGVAVNSANFLETLSFWDMRHCEPADGESADRTQLAAPDISAGQQDALFGAVAELGGLLNAPAVPAYPTPAHCNARGLTGLGEHVVDRLADRRMLIDPDHMSVKARNSLLDLLEARDYPGVLSSHSWATPDAYPRIYALGGFVAPYAGDSEGFVAKWRRHLGWADERYYFGFGFGADINGLGAQGDPRGADVANPVRYPFTGLNGVRVDRQRSGERVYDLNVDGVSHYGLYPDWIEDLRQVGGPEDGEAIVEDMSRGAEAYLQTWERGFGIAADSCRNPELRRRVSTVRDLVRPGMTPVAVMRAVGQPYTRLGDTYGLCARSRSSARVPMEMLFGAEGRVREVRRG
ncbi:peptidase [Nocardioides donggukensis]|uniref:Peptidase n=1 Tax=Nocardioides donggukensis TaxID=2774019 RepID=A0A927PZX8_9ACTN|nr:peptidase [Nocardioides donggukensis]MBD8868202.1 peptidase [Nocardioides donggukensis]